MAEIIIGDDTYIDPSWMDGTYGRGLVPRDMQSFPVGTFAPPADITLVDLTTLPDLIRQMESDKSRLSDIRNRGANGAPIPILDQGQVGYCWSHGPTQAAQILRAVMNQEYIPLSAYSVAATIKKGRDEGAWGALAVDFIIKNGIWPQSMWPQFDRKVRPASDPGWQEAAQYKMTHGWMELADPVYDRDLSHHQILSCLTLHRAPVPADQMYWGHHVVFLDVVDSFPNKSPNDLSRYGIRFLNSWKGWGDNGFAVATGSKARADNALAVTGMIAS